MQKTTKILISQIYLCHGEMASETEVNTHGNQLFKYQCSLQDKGVILRIES